MSSEKRPTEKKVASNGKEPERVRKTSEGAKIMDDKGPRKRTLRTLLRLLFLGERDDCNPHRPKENWRWSYPNKKLPVEDRK